jgi:hypothetical protein
LGTIVSFVLWQTPLVMRIGERAIHKAESHGYDRKPHHYLVMVAADGKVTREVDGLPVDAMGKAVKPADVVTTTTPPVVSGAPQVTQTASQPDATRQVVKTFVIVEIIEAIFPAAGKILRWILHIAHLS